MAQRMIERAALAALAVALAGTHASAEVRDAVYRGTVVCDMLPFFETAAREAMEVTIAGSVAKYTLAVRLHDRVEASAESGSGTFDGRNINLQGSWSGESDSYKSSYSGIFVRRSAKLAGTQIWTHDGKTFTRKCMGVIKRPLRAFLPREKKSANE